MAKQRHLMGYKHRFGAVDSDVPAAAQHVVEWLPRRDNRVVMHQISDITEVSTPDGPMLSVKLKQQAEFANPGVDVAVLVGHAKTYLKSGKVSPQSPELWFYDDKYWVKAKNSDGTEYYNNKCSLFYEVQVSNADKLNTSTGLE